MMAVLFDDTAFLDAAVEAVIEIRRIVSKECFISGMTGSVTGIRTCE